MCAEHCAFYIKNNHVCVAPVKEANTWINGKLIYGETVLNHGDRIVLGINHFFRLNCPNFNYISESSSLTSSQIRFSKSDNDFNMAQEEVLLWQNNKRNSILNNINSNQDLETNSSSIIDDENKSTISSHSNSTFEDNNGIQLELAIKKLEQEYSSINQNNSYAYKTTTTTLKEINFKKCLTNLRTKLLKTNSLVREANTLCKELNKPIKFSVTLQIPPYNLTPNRKVINF
jgi:kinesin family protein 13